MILLAWVLVTTTFLVSVRAESGCPSIEELKKMAKAMTDDPKTMDQMEKDLRFMIETIKNLPLNSVPVIVFAKELMVGNLYLQAMMGGYARVMLPEPKKGPLPPVFISCNATDPEIPEIKAMVEKFAPAFDNLTNLVEVQFKELREQVAEAVGKIEKMLKDVELVQFGAIWSQNVVKQMKLLSLSAESILEKKYVKAGGQVRAMARLCMDSQGSPTGIAAAIWSQFGAGCKNPPGVRSTTTIGQFCDRDHPLYTRGCFELEDRCYAEVIIERDDYDHRTANRISTVVTATMLELSMYHAMCVNFTWNDPEDIETANENFFKLINETLSEMSQIIIAKAERYWKEPAEKYLRQLMEGPGDLEKAEKAQKALNERYFWYEHQVFVMRAYASHSESTLQDGGFIFIFDHAQQYNIDGFLMVSRYRQTSDAEKADVRARYQNYLKWLKTPVPHEAKCYVEGHSDTVEGCIARASGDFEYLAILLLTIKLALTTVLLERIAILHPECANLAPPTTPFTHRNTSGGTDTGTDTSTVTSEPADAPIMAINLLLMTTSLIVMIF